MSKFLMIILSVIFFQLLNTLLLIETSAYDYVNIRDVFSSSLWVC